MSEEGQSGLAALFKAWQRGKGHHGLLCEGKENGEAEASGRRKRCMRVCTWSPKLGLLASRTRAFASVRVTLPRITHACSHEINIFFLCCLKFLIPVMLRSYRWKAVACAAAFETREISYIMTIQKIQ